MENEVLEAMIQPDVRIEEHGTVTTLQPCTLCGRSWIDANVEAEGWQWIGSRLAVEPRHVPDLVQGMLDDDLAVEGGMNQCPPTS